MDLSKLSEDELLASVQRILAQPGDITPEAQAELDAINAELQRREERKSGK